jgi:hypothetical protein
VIARGDQKVRSSQSEPVERRLRPFANGAMIDPAGRLMEDGDHRHAETARRERRTCERSGDRVEKEGVRSERLRPTKHCRPSKSGERERPFGKGEERDPRRMRTRRLRHSQVVQVTAAEAVWIA